MKEDDIYAFLSNRGGDVHQSHVTTEKKSGAVEALIITDIATGRVLATGDGIKFQDKTLVVEMNAANSAGSDISLTISWRGPSASYIAEYVDIAAANAKVKKLNECLYGDRRIQVEMNTQPPGLRLRNIQLNAIRINNLPPSVTDQDIIMLTEAVSVKRLGAGSVYAVDHVARLVQEDIERAVPGGLEEFDPPSTCNEKGIFYAHARFSSWDDAYEVYTCLSDKRYSDPPIWLYLPMHFAFDISVDQYNAQKAQWDSLVSSIKAKKACTFHVRESGKVVNIRLSGPVKEMTGALKARVQNLANGENVEGWHQALGIPNNPFVPRVHSETGAYLRVDWKRRSLTLYGMPGNIDRARGMIESELDRLASLDHTITLEPRSVGFFVREGIQQLKETFGKNSVRFIVTMSSRKLTVSGGEDARYALYPLTTLSRKDSHGLPNVAQGNETCPICYDTVSSPHQLDCGHTYCAACLPHFILSALESDELPLTCLGNDTKCRVPIPISTIKRFLPPAYSFNRLLETAFNAYIAKNPKLQRCKTPNCMQIYRTAKRGAAPQTLHCPTCFSAVCNGCHEYAHFGLSCAENKAKEQERLNSQGKRTKKCPRCSIPIEKPEGDDYTVCRYASLLLSLRSLSEFVCTPGAGRTSVSDARPYLRQTQFIVISALRI